MRSAETTLLRLTIGEPHLLAAMVNSGDDETGPIRLDERSEALVQIGALVALDAPATAYGNAVQSALEAGATLDDLVAVLYAVAVSVGSAKIVSAAPKIAITAGYDVEAALEAREP